MRDERRKAPDSRVVAAAAKVAGMGVLAVAIVAGMRVAKVVAAGFVWVAWTTGWTTGVMRGAWTGAWDSRKPKASTSKLTHLVRVAAALSAVVRLTPKLIIRRLVQPKDAPNNPRQVRLPAERVVNWIGWWIPKRHREFVIGDLAEIEIPAMREAELTERQIRRRVVFRLLWEATERFKVWRWPLIAAGLAKVSRLLTSLISGP